MIMTIFLIYKNNNKKFFIKNFLIKNIEEYKENKLQ